MLATQTMAMTKLKVRRIEVNGDLRPGVYAKDVILHIIRLLGAKGGIGYAYEYAGDVFDRMSMEERMTVCNMSIEGGARCGYVNPDEKTFDYLKGRPYARQDAAWDAAVARWRSFASDPGCALRRRRQHRRRRHRADRHLGHLPGPGDLHRRVRSRTPTDVPPAQRRPPSRKRSPT